jgi:hypothetical protein
MSELLQCEICEHVFVDGELNDDTGCCEYCLGVLAS